jgi:hypothetical protein
MYLLLNKRHTFSAHLMSPSLFLDTTFTERFLAPQEQTHRYTIKDGEKKVSQLTIVYEIGLLEVVHVTKSTCKWLLRC